VCLANPFAKQEGLYAGDVDLAQIDDLVAKGKRLLGLSDEVMADLRTGCTSAWGLCWSSSRR
jgi:hypothetical protein